MECAKVQPMIEQYADGELDAVNTNEIETHMQSCPACSQALENFATSQLAIRKAPYFSAPASLRKRIEHDFVAPAKKQKWVSTWQWPQFAASLALALIITTSISLYQADSTQTARLSEEVIAGHIRSLMANHLADVASSDQHTVKPWFNGKLDFAPPVSDLTEHGYALVGGRLDYMNNRTAAALVYRHRQHLINVFIWPETHSGNSNVATLSKQGYNLVHWTREGMVFWAVSDVRPADLAELAGLLQALPRS